MELGYGEYRAIVESSQNMIWRSGTDAKCNYFNETWLTFTGRTIEEEVGDGWTTGVHPEDFTECVETYLKAFQAHERFEMEYRLRRHDGEWRWINDRGVPFFAPDGRFQGYIGSCMDVTERVEGHLLTEMAHNDTLTGLSNRNYLDYLADYAFHRARQSGHQLMVVMIDIDKFKDINDRFGHPYGDRVLSQVAEVISGHIRKTDIAGRYGGDEFMLILQDSGLHEAEQIARRVLDSLPQLTVEPGHPQVSLSIGIARQAGDRTIHSLVERADAAMYEAKREGGNRWRVGL